MKIKLLLCGALNPYSATKKQLFFSIFFRPFNTAVWNVQDRQGVNGPPRPKWIFPPHLVNVFMFGVYFIQGQDEELWKVSRYFNLSVVPVPLPMGHFYLYPMLRGKCSTTRVSRVPFKACLIVCTPNRISECISYPNMSGPISRGPIPIISFMQFFLTFSIYCGGER